MKVDVRKVDAIKRELKFEIPKERVSEKLDEVYAGLGKVAKVKGFRQGKVPRPILEARHSQVAREEVIQKLIPEAYQEGLEKENLSPIDLPEILDVNFKDGIITFTAKLDIKPEFKIKEYKGIRIKRKSSDVTDEEINKTLEFFKQGQGKDKDVALDDAFAHGLGYPSLEDFKKSLARQMEMDKDRHNRLDVENQIIDHLLKQVKMLVPESLVKRQLDNRLTERRKYFEQQGMPKEEIDRKITGGQEDMKKAVEKDVKAYLILDKIAVLEEITIAQGENLPAKVMEFLLKEAKWEEGK